MRRASWETAIRAWILSRTGRSTGVKSSKVRERSIAVWKVETTGQSELMSASIDTEGTKGSCTWRTSKSPARSHARTSRLTRGPKARRAIEPL